MYCFQRSFLYFPQPSKPVKWTKEISFVGDKFNLHGWVVNEGKEKALIYYGGNAEAIEYNIAFFKEAAHDYSVYLIPYRGYGKNTGNPSEESLYKDSLYIFDKIKQNHKQILLMGRSLGTGISTYVASQRSIASLILVTPYDSIENVAKEIYWMFPISILLKDKYESWRRVINLQIPTLVFIADNDEIISKKRTDNLISHFDSKYVKVVTIKGATHDSISEFNEYLSILKQWLQ